jgi:hypothetical protein
MIEEVISRQNFEVVRDAIGAILKTEIENQRTKNVLLTEEVGVFLERTTPFQNSEEVVINITLNSSDYDLKNQKDSQGKTFYSVDIFTKGFATSNENGSVNSAFKLHRYLGIVRYILSHTMYKTLSLPPGFIGGTAVENFTVMENQFKEDSDFIKLASISFSVRINESQTLEEGTINLNEIFTLVKLDMTDLGYTYKKINE